MVSISIPDLIFEGQCRRHGAMIRLIQSIDLFSEYVELSDSLIKLELVVTKLKR